VPLKDVEVVELVNVVDVDVVVEGSVVEVVVEPPEVVDVDVVDPVVEVWVVVDAVFVVDVALACRITDPC
jgi:hypothetical protein